MSGRVTVEAPRSGVQLGRGQGGPLTLRLFRLTGTRLVVAARVAPAQLLALRAAAAGTPVQVVTGRPQLWEPLLPREAGHHVGPNEATQPSGGPTLTVDDRPVEQRAAAELRPWQCRVHIRSQWTPSVLPTFANADVTLFGAVPAEYIATVARAFGVPIAAVEPLTRLDSGSFGVLRRGRVEYVSLDPTSAEGQLLDYARG